MPVASWTAGRGAAAGEVLAVALDAVDGSIRLHKAPACALRASLCSPSPAHRGQLDTRVYSAKED